MKAELFKLPWKVLKDAEVRMTLGAIVGNLSLFVDTTLQPPISRVVTWSRKIWGCKFGVDFSLDSDSYRGSYFQ